MRLPSAFRSAPAACGAIALLAVSFLLGCGDDENPAKPDVITPSTQLTGTFINGYEGGLMTITVVTATLAPALRAAAIEPAAPVSASAILSPDVGGTIQLSGAYNETSDSLNLAGGDYSMAGRYSPTGSAGGGITGRYTGPNGAGFFGCAVGDTSAVQVYCGAYRNDAQTVSGRWNILIIGNEAVGVAAAQGGNFFGFVGSVSGSGTTRTITMGSGGGSGTLLSIDGTLDTAADTVGGTWTRVENNVVTDFGTWNGSRCLPEGTGPN